MTTTTYTISNRTNVIRLKRNSNRGKSETHLHHIEHDGIEFLDTVTANKSLKTNVSMIKQESLFNCTFLMLIIFNFITATVEGTSIQAISQQQQQQRSQAPHVIAIKEGADLDLSCPIVVQNEDMIISWTCDNEPANILSSRIHVTDSGKLRIQSAKVGDACNYRCEAADGFGTLSMIVKVIIVDKKLRDRLSRQNQTMSGKQLAIQNVRGYPSTGSKNAGKDMDNSAGIDDGSRKIEQQLEQQSDLEVVVEPANLYVVKNRTFSLECKVRHPPHLMVPQIIWLKEFIGPEPNSMSEAHEQNLVIIDDVYYHSLNWPRSISYSKQSACVNSALLVRQSSSVHSGRYICFAGYPPSIMSSFNMSLISSHDNSSDSVKTKATAGTTTLAMRQPVKYKMALARVKVGDLSDENGEKQKQLEQSDLKLISAITSGDHERHPKNLLISIFSTNSWIRNLTAVLTLFCILFIGLKLIYIRYRLNNNNGNIINSNNNSTKAKQTPDATSGGTDRRSVDNSTDMPITQQQHPSIQPQHYKQASNFSTTIQTDSLSGLNSTNYSQILSGVSRRLELLVEPTKVSNQQQHCDDRSSSSSAHLYSEICESDKMLTKPSDELNISGSHIEDKDLE